MSLNSTARRHSTQNRDLKSRSDHLSRQPAASPQPRTSAPGRARSFASPVGGAGRSSRRFAAGVIGIAMIAALAGCNDDKPDPIPTTSKTSSSTPTPTATKAAWESKYNANEIAEYQKALARLSAYERASQQVTTGNASPEMKKVLDEYFFSYKYLWGTLKYLDAEGYKSEGELKVLSSEATRIKVKGKEGSVSIRQCVDATDVITKKNGKIQKPGYSPVHLREIQLSTPANGGKYLIATFVNKETPCAD